MKEIYVKNSEAPMLVDDDDFERMSAFKWRVTPNGYAIRTVYSRETQKYSTVNGHRTVMRCEAGDGKMLDHVNGAKLDNRKSNLRFCTNQQNQYNQKPHKDGSGYKGVCFVPRSGKWQTSIKIGRKVKYLGQFETPELAHEFYCLAADMIQGGFAHHRGQ